jgi:hypothetical protein
MTSSTHRAWFGVTHGWLLATAVAMGFLVPRPGQAQLRVAAYALSQGAGFTAGESVRVGVTLGLPVAGLAASPESAGGAGFWYTTRDQLVIVAAESEETPDGIPTEFELRANYPNPFNPTTRIRYGVPRTALVRIEIYNILGQLVANLVTKEQTAGYYDVDWNGRDAGGALAPSGVYFYRIESDDFVATRPMVLQK